ncbi:MAG: GDSL-type esterase/lipase family protein [Verrucomicrobiota bacterium]|jgi:lysophospholipase L1-like esterase
METLKTMTISLKSLQRTGITLAILFLAGWAHAQIIRYQVGDDTSWTGQVEERRAYRPRFSSDLTSWSDPGDVFLPSDRVPLSFPEGDQGFVQLVPDVHLDEFEPRVVLLGDSTMADLSALSIQYHGWGQHFQDFFRPEANFINLAEAGMGTIQYFARNKTKALEVLQPDFVILQFGHIEHRDGTSTALFEENLGKIVDEIRGIGAVPLLVTPVAIRLYDAKDNHINELAERRDSVIKIANQKHSQYLDLNLKSAEVYARMGIISSAFITVCGNECDDLSHFSRTGAYLMAALLCEQLPEILQAYRHPLDELIPTIDAAFDVDRRFSSLSTPFKDLTGFEDEQVWEWLFPEGTVPLP